jgi:hypothetical protein
MSRRRGNREATAEEVSRIAELDRVACLALWREIFGMVAPKRLIREWNGRTHEVEVLPDGYLWKGRRFRSLSAVAREITGARWSGPRFFGAPGRR